MNPSIVQLRGTIFTSSTIGFTEELKNKFLPLLPGGQVQPVIIPFLPQASFPLGQQMTIGGPWKIVKDGRSIVFNPQSVDVIEGRYNDFISSEEEFAEFCVKVLSKITDYLGHNTRLAYCPTFAMDQLDGFICKDWWATMFSSTTQVGVSMQEINLTYLLKKGFDLNGKKLTLNMHHNIFDGYRYNKNNVKENDSIIITLDINTVPQSDVKLEPADVKPFFEKALKEKEKLMNNYFGV